jgi:hypothetical protein
MYSLVVRAIFILSLGNATAAAAAAAGRPIMGLHSRQDLASLMRLNKAALVLGLT